MTPKEGAERPRERGDAGTLHHIRPGSLAWTPCAEQGFVTVKVLGVCISDRTACVEVHPEGAARIAAAHAAVAVVREAAAGRFASDPHPICAPDAQQRSSYQESMHPPRMPEGNKNRRHHKCQSHEPLPYSPAAATEALPEPLSPRGTHPQACSAFESHGEEARGQQAMLAEGLCEPSDQEAGNLLSATPAETPAAAAAATAAAAASAAFVPRLPLTVALSHLWPYSAPPMPPDRIPDDSASCDTLSAAALLQQLQHRYLRNEIYTYAAHVLLAVNPYKPLPHLYSAQQILLYRHWREVARAYRRHLSSSESGDTGVSLLHGNSNASDEVIRSILQRLPGVLPLNALTTDECPHGSSRAVAAGGDGIAPSPWTRTSYLAVEDAAGPAEEAAAVATEQAFKESAARVNKPPPHPFVVAEEALRRLMGAQTSQTIVVSGQSGAGKTETSKQLMLFLTHASTSPDSPQQTAGHRLAGPHHDFGSPANASEHRRRVAALTGGVQTLREAAELRKRIVSCNAIFESFGNAATRRNHNSSRIGRLTLLHFDSGGFLRGGSMRTYLLEAARITAHKRGDRNFHVFYQLLRGKHTAHTSIPFAVLRCSSCDPVDTSSGGHRSIGIGCAGLGTCLKGMLRNTFFCYLRGERRSAQLTGANTQ